MENTLHKEKFYSELYKRLISFLLSLLSKDWPCWLGQPPSTQKTHRQPKRSLGVCSAEPCQAGSFSEDLLLLATGPGNCAWSTSPNRGLKSWLVPCTSTCPCSGSQGYNPSPPQQPLPWMDDQHNPLPSKAPSQAARQSTSCLSWASRGKEASWTPPPSNALHQETAQYNRWGSMWGLQLCFHVWSLKVPRQHRSSAELSLINVTAERILWA